MLRQDHCAGLDVIKVPRLGLGEVAFPAAHGPVGVGDPNRRVADFQREGLEHLFWIAVAGPGDGCAGRQGLARAFAHRGNAKG